ncbi:hypothetical protein [Streptosporangium saharense]|uniref:Uncharacterized protein n=1 Tax=Streptosporangium saharense TaxID=1706840 RepID=A0A7W7VLS6_9ACTN|nr:hypothetical protein [Streptosporangium saharense]MBB4914908.1 hypothetical protein [Streptosporangium saharense]
MSHHLDTPLATKNSGPARVAALMATRGVSVKRRVGGVGELQRERLSSAVSS